MSWRCLLVAASVGLSACADAASNTGDSRVEADGTLVEILENGDLRPGLPFRYQPLSERSLDELGERERLDEVVGEAASELDRILALKDWVAAQWPHGDPDPYPPWNALIILDWIRSGRTGGFCAQYSQVFLQALAYLGLTARYVEIGTPDNPYAHYPVEVWSNELNRWVLMDVDYNLHFERNGTPLDALEVHRALLRGETEAVAPVLGVNREGHPEPASWAQGTMELYYYLRFHLKADQLTRFWEAPFDRFNDMVEWQSERAVPWEDSAAPSDYPKERLTDLRTSSRHHAYPALNQTHVTAGISGPGRVSLRLANNAVDFSTYEIGAGSGVAHWRPIPDDEFVWELEPGSHVLQVRARNVRGVAGPAVVVLAAFRDTAE